MTQEELKDIRKLLGTLTLQRTPQVLPKKIVKKPLKFVKKTPLKAPPTLKRPIKSKTIRPTQRSNDNT